MENKQTDVLKDNRENTDNSLKFERNKTDNYLDRESQTVEDESDEIVSSKRREADRKLKESRDQSDKKRFEETTKKSPLLDAERKRSDSDRKIARNEEDKVRNEERDQKKQIAQELLNTERAETDSNLLFERDVTDEASVSNSVLVTNAQEALSTRDTYLGILSHDLKNPLAAISLSSSAMKRAFEKNKFDKKTIDKYFSALERNVSSMGRMIEDLLDVEQMVNGELKLKLIDLDLNKLVLECKELFEPIAESKLFTINVSLCETEAIASADHDRLLQVLSNLVGNAVKYTKENGTIFLSVEKNNNKILVSVKDEGPGIPPEKLGIIFERFTQLNGNDRKGVGLGLFISKWIIESHKGEIFVNSVLGEGSNFSFSLPCIDRLH